MEKKVLVAYASKHGATKEIADRIADKLAGNNLKVDVMQAKKIGDLTAYGAVIIGSGVYIGQWIKESVKFIKGNEAALMTLPVWIFSSGPTGEGDASELVQGWKVPRGIQENVEKIQPKDIVVFHGAIDDAKLSGLERWMIGKVGAAKGDFRDWAAIDQWASEVGAQLQ